MALKIYNSLTKQKEEFKPLKEGQVKMYVCGPTVYDEPHIGHLRSAYVFDVMRRYLEYSGYKVTFVRNVTDVDDKIIEKARQNGSDDLLTEVKSVSEKYLLAYKKDLEALGIQEPTKEPKATAHIQDMVWLIEKLLKNGHAYEAQGDVYFDVNSYKDYGKLSHQKKDEMMDHVRVDANEKKKSPLDFALWKKSKEGEPSWDSPWGKGRPGWHIECSAMSMKYLGETFDIHGGGRDLIFPHHENEIAQSEGVTNSTFARYWVHHGLITVNEQKMSKSLKNYKTLSEITKKASHGAEELKLLFLGTHYSMPLDYSEERMKMEKAVFEKFLFFLRDLSESSDRESSSPRPNEESGRFEAAFKEAMNDDFNTPQALTVMHEMVHYARKTQDPAVQLAIGEQIRKYGEILGLSFPIMIYKHEDIKISTEVAAQIAIRSIAKDRKDFKEADKIRDKLLKEHDIELVDKPDGTTTWRRKI